MEATQALEGRSGGGSTDDDIEDEFSEEFRSKVIAKLRLTNAGDLNGVEMEVRGGENNIGRDSERCNIVIQAKGLSRVHAVIEVSPDGCVTIHDNNSLNDTYKNGHKLKPGVHYALEGGEKLKFGDIEAIYSPVGAKDATGNETLVNISQAPTQIIQRDDEADVSGATSEADESEIFVPETPARTVVRGADLEIPTPFRSPLPASTPRRPAPTTFKVPESPLVLESSTDVSTGANATADSSSSFIAASQTMLPPCSKLSITARVAAKQNPGTKTLMEMETQALATQKPGLDGATQAFEIQPKRGNETLNMLEMETQAMSGPRATQMNQGETQAFELSSSNAEADDSDFLAPTQAFTSPQPKKASQVARAEKKPAMEEETQAFETPKTFKEPSTKANVSDVDLFGATQGFASPKEAVAMETQAFDANTPGKAARPALELETQAFETAEKGKNGGPSRVKDSKECETNDLFAATQDFAGRKSVGTLEMETQQFAAGNEPAIADNTQAFDTNKQQQEEFCTPKPVKSNSKEPNLTEVETQQFDQKVVSEVTKECSNNEAEVSRSKVDKNLDEETQAFVGPSDEKKDKMVGSPCMLETQDFNSGVGQTSTMQLDSESNLATNGNGAAEENKDEADWVSAHQKVLEEKRALSREHNLAGRHPLDDMTGGLTSEEQDKLFNADISPSKEKEVIKEDTKEDKIEDTKEDMNEDEETPPPTQLNSKSEGDDQPTEEEEEEESPLPTQLDSKSCGGDQPTEEEEEEEESPLPTQLNTSWVPDEEEEDEADAPDTNEAELPDSTSQAAEDADRPSSRAEESEKLNDSVDLLADEDEDENDKVVQQEEFQKEEKDTAMEETLAADGSEYAMDYDRMSTQSQTLVQPADDAAADKPDEDEDVVIASSQDERVDRTNLVRRSMSFTNMAETNTTSQERPSSADLFATSSDKGSSRPQSRSEVGDSFEWLAATQTMDKTHMSQGAPSSQKLTADELGKFAAAAIVKKADNDSTLRHEADEAPTQVVTDDRESVESVKEAVDASAADSKDVDQPPEQPEASKEKGARKSGRQNKRTAATTPSNNSVPARLTQELPSASSDHETTTSTSERRGQDKELTKDEENMHEFSPAETAKVSPRKSSRQKKSITKDQTSNPPDETDTKKSPRKSPQKSPMAKAAKQSEIETQPLTPEKMGTASAAVNPTAPRPARRSFKHFKNEVDNGEEDFDNKPTFNERVAAKKARRQQSLTNGSNPSEDEPFAMRLNGGSAKEADTETQPLGEVEEKTNSAERPRRAGRVSPKKQASATISKEAEIETQALDDVDKPGKPEVRPKRGGNKSPVKQGVVNSREADIETQPIEVKVNTSRGNKVSPVRHRASAARKEADIETQPLDDAVKPAPPSVPLPLGRPKRGEKLSPVKINGARKEADIETQPLDNAEKPVPPAAISPARPQKGKKLSSGRQKAGTKEADVETVSPARPRRGQKTTAAVQKAETKEADIETQPLVEVEKATPPAASFSPARPRRGQKTTALQKAETKEADIETQPLVEAEKSTPPAAPVSPARPRRGQKTTAVQKAEPKVADVETQPSDEEEGSLPPAVHVSPIRSRKGQKSTAKQKVETKETDIETKPLDDLPPQASASGRSVSSSSTRSSRRGSKSPVKQSTSEVIRIEEDSKPVKAAAAKRVSKRGAGKVSKENGGLTEEPNSNSLKEPQALASTDKAAANKSGGRGKAKKTEEDCTTKEKVDPEPVVRRSGRRCQPSVKVSSSDFVNPGSAGAAEKKTPPSRGRPRSRSNSLESRKAVSPANKAAAKAVAKTAERPLDELKRRQSETLKGGRKSRQSTVQEFFTKPEDTEQTSSSRRPTKRRDAADQPTVRNRKKSVEVDPQEEVEDEPAPPPPPARRAPKRATKSEVVEKPAVEAVKRSRRTTAITTADSSPLKAAAKRGKKSEVKAEPASSVEPLDVKKEETEDEAPAKRASRRGGAVKAEFVETQPSAKGGRGGSKRSLAVKSEVESPAKRRKVEPIKEEVVKIEPPERKSRAKDKKTPLSRVMRRESSGSSTRDSPTRVKKKPTVVFTGYEDKSDLKSVKEMGGFVTASASDVAADVLVTDRVRRTAKFMCAMARGMPVVGPAWIAQSKMTKTFLDPWQHIIKDEESEKKWKFNLSTSLSSASKRPLLKGWSVHATKNCTPPPTMIREIVEASDGVWLSAPPTGKPDDRTLLLSCQKDKAVCAKSAKKGHLIHEVELLLTGLLRHELDLKAYLVK